MLLKLFLLGIFLTHLSPAMSIFPVQQAELLENRSFAKADTAANCFRYMCNPAEDGVPMAPDTCTHFEDETFYLQSCSKRTDGRTFCPKSSAPDFQDEICSEPPSNPDYSSFPGEPCIHDSDCMYGFCNTTSTLCQGTAEDEECTVDGECQPGLFCTARKCTRQQPMGAPCAYDFDCENTLGCNKTGFLGTCIPLYTSEIGDGVSDCIQSTSKLCETGTCRETGFSTHGYCIKPIYNQDKSPYECLSSDECIGESTGKTYSSTCQCGYNPSGTAYCSQFYGDSAGKNALHYWSLLMRSNATAVCNTTRRYNYKCIQSTDYKYKDLVVRSNLYFLYYPQVQQNDDCIKDIYTSYYWEQKAAVKLALAALWLLVLSH